MKVIAILPHTVLCVVVLSINNVLPIVSIHVRREMRPKIDTESNADSNNEFDTDWNDAGHSTLCHPTTTQYDENIHKCVALPCQTIGEKIASREIVTNKSCDKRTTTWDSIKSMCMPQQICVQLPFTAVNILYQDPQPIPVDEKYKPSDVIVGDVNNDGVADVVFSSIDIHGYWINIYSNFKQIRRFNLINFTADISVPTELALADLNGDGYLDLVIATYTGVYYVLEPGNLETEIDMNTVHNRGSCQGITVADMDGDGILDITLGWRQRAVWLFRGEVDALSNFRGFSETEEVIAEDTPPCGVHAIIATDVDEDNMIDLVVGGDEFPLSFLTDEKATKCFLERSQCEKFYDCSWEDDLAVCSRRKIFDLDEKYTCHHPHLIEKNTCERVAECVWNTIENSCEEKPWTINYLAENEIIPPPIDCEKDADSLPKPGTRYYCAEDFNNDGIIDLVGTFKWDESSSLSMYLGGERSNFQKTWGVKIAVTGYDYGIFGLACADFDNDGHIDMAVTNRDRNELLLFKNHGEGTFGTPQLINLDPYGCEYPGEVAVGDIDGDGKIDISIPCRRSHGIVWLKNEDASSA